MPLDSGGSAALARASRLPARQLGPHGFGGSQHDASRLAVSHDTGTEFDGVRGWRSVWIVEGLKMRVTEKNFEDLRGRATRYLAHVAEIFGESPGPHSKATLVQAIALREAIRDLDIDETAPVIHWAEYRNTTIAEYAAEGRFK